MVSQSEFRATLKTNVMTPPIQTKMFNQVGGRVIDCSHDCQQQSPKLWQTSNASLTKAKPRGGTSAASSCQNRWTSAPCGFRRRRGKTKNHKLAARRSARGEAPPPVAAIKPKWFRKEGQLTPRERYGRLVRSATRHLNLIQGHPGKA